MADKLYVPRNAISLARLSDATPDPVTGEIPQDGTDEQLRMQREWAARHGWTITLEHAEPSLTAYTRIRKVMPDGTEVHRVWRPDLQMALRRLWRRQNDGLIVLDLDRYGRDPYDLEDLITLVEAREGEVRVASLTGSLDLDTDAGMAQARVQMAFARKNSQDTARRVKVARRLQAATGRFGGGMRRFGFLKDGVTPDVAEYAVVAQAAQAVLSGLSLRSCVADLKRRGVPTVTGAKWTTTTLRDTLLRPRNAAIMSYNGEEMGPAPWPAIIPEDQWRALVALLNAPDRRTTTGPEPRWLGSGAYLCGKCHGVTYANGQRCVYRCSAAGHVTWNQPRTDEWVEEVLVQRLRRPDAVDLLSSPAARVDVGALRARAAELRRNRSDLAAAKAAGAISQADLLRGAKVINEELARIEQALVEVSGDGLLLPLVTAEDVRAAWDGLATMAARREVLRRVLRVTLMPIGRGYTFSRDGIVIEQLSGAPAGKKKARVAR